MSRKRSFYAGQRRRDNTNGGIGMATYRLDRAREEYANRWKGYNVARTIAKRLTGKPVPGQRLKGRKKR